MAAIDLQDDIVKMSFSRNYINNPDDYDFLFDLGLTGEMLERFNGEIYPLTVNIDTRHLYLDEIIDLYPDQTVACYTDMIEGEFSIEKAEKMARRIWFNIYPMSSRVVTMVPKELSLFTLVDQQTNSWTGILRRYRFEWDEKDPSYGEMASSHLVLMKERTYEFSVPLGTFD